MARRSSPKAVDRFEFERSLRREGVKRIAGVDEAGRGPLAGPVVAAAAILPDSWIEEGLPPAINGLNDSKQLREAERESFFQFLTSHDAVQFAVVEIDAAVIDDINILRATQQAMHQALARLQPPPDHVLIDGLRVQSVRWPQTAIVKGDSLSYSIAAASVLAKVTRDRLMLEYDREFPAYGFSVHKGYGTPAHLTAISEHGPCAIHRRSFAPFKPVQGELFQTT